MYTCVASNLFVKYYGLGFDELKYLTYKTL